LDSVKPGTGPVFEPNGFSYFSCFFIYRSTFGHWVAADGLFFSIESYGQAHSHVFGAHPANKTASAEGRILNFDIPFLIFDLPN
jgi:hypothetical protein